MINKKAIAMSAYSFALRASRHSQTALAAALAVAIASVFAAHSAKAADATFAGTWADDLAQCKTEQDIAGAPMIVTKSGYNQHETHCRFKSVKDRGPGEWNVAGSCSVEGDEQPIGVTLTLSGDTLTMTDAAGSRDLLRCP